VKNGLLTTNPIQNMEKPPANSRGREILVGPEDHHRVLTVVSRNFRPFLIALENTGARLQELAQATAKDWDDKLGALVYYARPKKGEFSHKTSGKKKERVVFFTGEALAMMRELVRRYPDGPLFRTGHRHKDDPGPPRWRPKDIVKVFGGIRKKIGTYVTAYSYRHTKHTNLLLAGMDVGTWAKGSGSN
jgi:hypothetical protein